MGEHCAHKKQRTQTNQQNPVVGVGGCSVPLDQKLGLDSPTGFKVAFRAVAIECKMVMVMVIIMVVIVLSIVTVITAGKEASQSRR